MLTKKEAKNHKKKKKYVKGIYRCEHCNSYHVTGKKYRLDKAYYQGNNELGRRLIREIEDGRFNYTTKDGYYKVYLDNAVYIVRYDGTKCEYKSL